MDPCNAIPDSDHRKRAAGRAPSPIGLWNILHELLSSAKMKQTGTPHSAANCFTVKEIVLFAAGLAVMRGACRADGWRDERRIFWTKSASAGVMPGGMDFAICDIYDIYLDINLTTDDLIQEEWKE